MQFDISTANQRSAIVRVFATAIVAGFALFTVGCSDDFTPPTAAKVSEPTIQTELMALENRPLTKVEDPDDLQPKCADGLKTVYISANSSRDYVEVDDSGVAVKVIADKQPNPGSSATFVFRSAQANVRSTFVTMATGNTPDNFSIVYLPPSSVYHAVASWPRQGLTEAISVRVEAKSFLNVADRLLGWTLCIKR